MNFEHKRGVSVKEIKPEKNTATTIVIANSLNSFPTTPPIKSIGMKTGN